MALTPAEQHHKNTHDELQRVIGEAEHVHNWVGIDYTETDRQQAAVKLDAALQRNDDAWNAVQTERYGPRPVVEMTGREQAEYDQCQAEYPGEPPAECWDDNGTFRGDPGWENRWSTYQLDHDRWPLEDARYDDQVDDVTVADAMER